MKYTVKQVAEQTGISVRTLHYYDEIGLLKPSEVTNAGYRLYDEDCLYRLQQILFFRELDFSLKDILRILNHPDFDKNEALNKHRKLLMLKRKRLDGLIALVDKTLKGENTMSFKEFDMTEIESVQKQYAREVEERWGDSAAFQESQGKTAKYKKEDWASITAESETIYRAFALHLADDPADPAVQKLVADWQAYITRYFYQCTNDILAGLGIMYVEDERFKQNIDRYGEGLASFMSRAISIYCKR